MAHLRLNMHLDAREVVKSLRKLLLMK